MKAVVLTPNTLRLILDVAGTPCSVETIGEHDFWEGGGMDEEEWVEPHEHYAVLHIDDDGVTNGIDWGYHTLEEALYYAKST